MVIRVDYSSNNGVRDYIHSTDRIHIKVLTTLPFLPPANEVCEGYAFTPVCHSVHKGGRPRQVPPSGRYSPWARTPPGRYTPLQIHPPGRYTPLGRYTPRAETPMDRDPHGQRPPLRTETTPLDRDFPWAETPLDRDAPRQRPPPPSREQNHRQV